MNLNIKKIAATAVLAVAVVGGTLSATTPAQATHQIGHAAIGGFIGALGGSLLGGSINRRNRPYYVAPPPVYIAPPPVYGGLPPQHYDWCFNRYRSYHAASNTFQPYGGYPRRACRSPWF